MICRRPSRVKVNRTGYKKLDVHYSYAPATASGIALVPCGQCLNCRVNQARIWTNRILLEQSQSSECSFVTLTYDEDHLPDPPEVKKSHLQNYLKRLRYYVEPNTFRFFAVGEYGDHSFRPHYHLCLFNLGIQWEEHIKKAWSVNDDYFCNPDIGISVGELTPASARYIAGYVTKKIDKVKGCHPVDFGLSDEFMLSSRKGGGIGKSAAVKIRDQIDNSQFTDMHEEDIDVIRVGGKKYPLGRYLKQFTKGKMKWEKRLLKFKVHQEKLFDEKNKNAGDCYISRQRRKI